MKWHQREFRHVKRLYIAIPEGFNASAWANTVKSFELPKYHYALACILENQARLNQEIVASINFILPSFRSWIEKGIVIQIYNEHFQKFNTIPLHRDSMSLTTYVSNLIRDSKNRFVFKGVTLLSFGRFSINYGII